MSGVELMGDIRNSRRRSSQVCTGMYVGTLDAGNRRGEHWPLPPCHLTLATGEGEATYPDLTEDAVVLSLDKGA